jgi:hypothetical protein
MHTAAAPTKAARGQHFKPRDILFMAAEFLVFWTMLMSSVSLSICLPPGSVTDITIKD